MQTVADILRASGLNDDQIKALDAKVLTGFEGVITQSQQQLDQAELAKRAQEQMYADQIAPALDSWGNEKANLEAQVAFYKTQNENARTGGFVPTDAPGFVPGSPQRGNDGKFVPNGNAVPGSPDIVHEIRREVGGAFADGMWAMQEYQRMTGGGFLPDDVVALATEANAQRLPFRDYVARKYDFSGKKSALDAAKQKEHDDAIRAEVVAQKDREFAEKYGSNPNLRASEPSRFGTLERAVKEGNRPDPLTLSPEQRRSNTRSAIQADIAENQTIQ